MISYVLFSETAEKIPPGNLFQPLAKQRQCRRGTALSLGYRQKTIDLHTHIFGWVFLKVTVSLLGFPIFSWVSPRLRFLFCDYLVFLPENLDRMKKQTYFCPLF